MNAKTFFSQDAFNQIQQYALAQKEFPLGKYCKEYSTNGNRYRLNIYASHYNFGNHEYFVSLLYDYNYPGVYQSRNIGGGSGGTPVLSSYDAFCESINSILRKFPDYKEPEFVPEQLSLF